ncbi:LCP family protein [Candidatus Saccharibacteria bacterium]|nr:LCP family protein [Candidatus Saccharibacteria bacterium]
MKKSIKNPVSDNNPDQADIYQVGKALPIHNSTVTPEESRPKKRLTKKKITLIIMTIIIGLGVVYGSVLWNKINGIFNGNLFDLITKNEPLKQDASGRTNILIFGTSEDDEGHSGAHLADSILVLSVNQTTYDANMVSVPRDLWVKYNSTCSLGNQGKINASYYCALDQYEQDEVQASSKFAEQVGVVLGVDVHYYAKINYTVVKDVVDALGGIDVNIESDDPRGIYDVATKLKLPNGVSSIDGDTALNLSRARGSFGGYGFSSSNFDRERNQQAVAKGILDKASSSGTLANPTKVISVFGSLGQNITSNIETSSLKTAVSIASNVSSDKIIQLSLDDEDNRLVTTGTYNGVSIVRPVQGIFDYSEIQAYISQAFAKTTTTEQTN